MKKIEVRVLNESSKAPAGMMMFLAKLTQRGHKIHNMSDLMKLYNGCVITGMEQPLANEIFKLPHGTIKRFTPITIAIAGASRRFLMQARTHQVGMTYVSASMQYSNYTRPGSYDPKDAFCTPYELLKKENVSELVDFYNSCVKSMDAYRIIARAAGNDAAGYAAPHALRNILIMQGNYESWSHFIQLRTCNRNTKETQYVALRIWEALSKTTDGEIFTKAMGPFCTTGMCREGKMSCGRPMIGTNPTKHIKRLFPLVLEGE